MAGRGVVLAVNGARRARRGLTKGLQSGHGVGDVEDILGDDALLGGLGRNGLAEGSVELPTEALW